MHVPVAHMDRPPNEGTESELFTYKPATEWDEHWVLIDVPQARSVMNSLIESFNLMRSFPMFP